MSLTGRINAALQRVTGLRVTRETPEQRAQAIREASRRGAERARRRVAEKHRRKTAARLERMKDRYEKRLRLQQERHAAEKQRILARRQEELRRNEERRAQQELERLEAQKEAQKRKEEERARGEDLPGYFDEEKRRIIAKVRPRTMTHPSKLEALIDATRYVVRDQIPGGIVECGVWRGGSMQAVALALRELGDTGRELHLFDTFEGMPPPTSEDKRTVDGRVVSAEDLLATSDKDSWMWAVADLEDVKHGMAESGYPNDRIRYHPGLVEETTPGEAPEQIAILRLDTDWYASTLHALQELYERLSPGGVLILDDYGDWDGARQATDEWLAKTRPRLFLAPMASGRIGIKPLGNS